MICKVLSDLKYWLKMIRVLKRASVQLFKLHSVFSGHPETVGICCKKLIKMSFNEVTDVTVGVFRSLGHCWHLVLIPDNWSSLWGLLGLITGRSNYF